MSFVELPPVEPQLPSDDRDSGVDGNCDSNTASITSSILNYEELHGRTYASRRWSQDIYWGPNDETQADSQDIQHRVFLLLLNDKLHLAPLSPGSLNVIDIGTGTGAWVMDFADEYSNFEVTGTDISPIQPAWVPTNAKFELDDFNNDWTLPENHFDFIHMRWLVGSVYDWNKLLGKVKRSLKTGGRVEFTIGFLIRNSVGKVLSRGRSG